MSQPGKQLVWRRPRQEGGQNNSQWVLETHQAVNSDKILQCPEI